MGSFTKTIIVDRTASGYPHTIREGVDLLPAQGGVVYVESGEYEIDGTSNGEDKQTVDIPSNVTLIGNGNVVVNVKANIPAFRNKDYQSGGNSNITISGFKIVFDTEALYEQNLIDFRNVKKCLLEKLYITGGGHL
jgi:hypothetical protein